MNPSVIATVTAAAAIWAAPLALNNVVGAASAPAQISYVTDDPAPTPPPPPGCEPDSTDPTCQPPPPRKNHDFFVPPGAF